MLTNLALAAAAAFAGPSASTPIASPSLVSSVAPVTVGDDLPESASAVSFTTEDKQVLKASYYQPKKSKKAKSAAPAALLLHDAGKSREDLEELAAYLHKRGFAVMTLDLRGHGESETDKSNFEKANGKMRESMWSLSSRDVDAAAEFLSEQRGVHSTNLSIIGFGAGATLAVRHAAVDENVRGVVLVEPDPKAYGYNLVKGVSELGGLPTLVMASAEGREVARRLQEAAHEDNEGLEYVDVTKLKSDAEDLIDDKKLKSSMAGWLRDQAMPRK